MPPALHMPMRAEERVGEVNSDTSLSAAVPEAYARSQKFSIWQCQEGGFEDGRRALYWGRGEAI